MTSPPSLSEIKAFFFDAGGTLFRPHPSVGEVYAEVASRYGLSLDPEELELAFHGVWHKKDSYTRPSVKREEKSWWKLLVHELFSGFGKMHNFDAFFDELYDRFARPETWRLFPDTLPTLEALKKKGKILGVVSNWDDRLFGICEGLGVSPYFDFILASAVVGAPKPDAKIFKEALKRSAVRPQEALHVGDSLEDDVLGAERVGIHGIFLDRKGARKADTFTISTLQFLCLPSEN